MWRRDLVILAVCLLIIGVTMAGISAGVVVVIDRMLATVQDDPR